MGHAITICVALFVVGCGVDPPASDSTGGETPASQIASVQFEVVDELGTGMLSGIRERRRSVIRAQDEWEALWDELTGAVMPRPDPPTIDFSERMVVVAAMGEQPTGGYGVVIDSVMEEATQLTVHVAEESPGSSCTLIQIITAPAVAISLPRSDKLVDFAEDTRMRECL